MVFLIRRLPHTLLMDWVVRVAKFLYFGVMCDLHLRLGVLHSQVGLPTSQLAGMRQQTSTAAAVGRSCVLPSPRARTAFTDTDRARHAREFVKLVP